LLKMQQPMRVAACRIGVFVAALTIVCTTHARNGTAHGSSTSSSGGHGFSGHAAPQQGHHGGGSAPHHCARGGSGYDAFYASRSEPVDRELHERMVKTQQRNDAFMKSHPCPIDGMATGGCPGYVIDCIDPNPSEPERCFDLSNVEWRPARASLQ
jgi:hypothetical protein